MAQKNPLKPLTFKGWLGCFLLRNYFSYKAGKHKAEWEYPLPGYEENPATWSNEQKIYTAYKFYSKPHLKADKNSGLEDYFKNQKLKFSIPDNFQEESSITIHAGGDLMTYELIEPDHTRFLWDEIGDWFFNADIVYANLETPIDVSKPANPVPELLLENMMFNASEENFRIFNGNEKYKGFDILSIANNHMLDMGHEGLLATQNFLRSKNIIFTGAVDSPEKKGQIPIVERNGIKTAFINYTYSCNTFLPENGKEWMCNYLRINLPSTDISELIQDVKKARESGADLVVAALHTGNCYQAYPSEHTVQMFHQVFEKAGPDIILGTHPHNPQPSEKYDFTDPFSGDKKSGFAIYSMGDFVAYDIFKWCHLPLLLEISAKKGNLDGKAKTFISDIKILPVFTCLDKNKQLRFLHLEKNYTENFFSSEQKTEQKELREFYQKYIRQQN